MTVAANPDVLVHEIHIAAPPERVFQALTDPRQVPQWWGQQGTYRCTEFSADLRPGGKWRNSGVRPDGSAFEAKGEYLEVDPPRLLVHTWIASWTGDVQTTVRWELVPSGEGTLLKLRHSGLAAHPEIAQNYRGWPFILGWLQAFVERGETSESRKAAS